MEFHLPNLCQNNSSLWTHSIVCPLLNLEIGLSLTSKIKDFSNLYYKEKAMWGTTWSKQMATNSRLGK